MMPKLTDDAVSRLPIAAGRHQLLEELVGAAAPARPRPRWAAPLAAAAAVAVLAGGGGWWAEHGSAGDQWAQATDSPADARYAVLDAAGWTAQGGSTQAEYAEVRYGHEAQTLEVTTFPASVRAARLADRRHINQPAADGEAVSVLGVGGQLFTYSADDHTVISDVVNGRFIEARGQGLDEAAYRALLGDLRLTDDTGFAAAMPATPAGSDSDAVLHGIQQYVDPLWPPELDGVDIDPDRTDPYRFQASMAAIVACPWLDDYAEARRTDDAARAARDAAVLATTRQWPVLVQMGGDFPGQVWGYADQVAAGTVPQGYDTALGCP